MLGPKSRDNLRREWQVVNRTWCDVYRWPSLSNAKYSEEIAALILPDYNQIGLNLEGLRRRPFKISSHRGQCRLKKSAKRFREQRFVRALYNCHVVDPLGETLDYEVPLKETRGAPHGKIDLLSHDECKLFIVEAKANCQDSLLRAMLQAFMYTCLVHSVKSRFLGDYGLKCDTILTPAVLTLASVSSGEQLIELEKYPSVRNLLGKLNDDLARIGEGRIEFYLGELGDVDLDQCLIFKPFGPSAVKIVFKDGPRPQFRRVPSPR